MMSGVTCRTCELRDRRDAGAAPPWDSIWRTPEWDVVHAYDSAIEGWTVIAARRHLTAVADLTEHEAIELGRLVRVVSQALAEILGCAKTYVAQFAEHPEHPHVHFHVVPRAHDLPAEQRGPSVFKVLDATDERRIPEPRMNEIAARMSAILEERL
jgi:diadenosine tetraphosphate (Ap4A) HIT family hydrolase